MTDVEEALLIAGVLCQQRSPDGGFWAGQVRKTAQRELGTKRFSWGTLLPALRRLEMEVNGFLESWWGEDPEGNPRRYYRLTPKGMDEAGLARARWAQTVAGTEQERVLGALPAFGRGGMNA